MTLIKSEPSQYTPNSGPDQESSLLSANLVKLVGTHHRQGWRQPERERGPGQRHQLQRRWPEYQCRQCGQRQSAGGRKQPVTNASTSFASPFTSSFGADGAGTLVYSLNVSAAGADSGLNDTATGQDILLYLESGSVVGRVGGSSGSAAFTPVGQQQRGGDTRSRRAIAHTRTAARIREQPAVSQPGETGGHHHRQGWRQPERERGTWQVPSASKTMARVSVPAVRPTTVCRWTKATCHQCQHQLCQPVHQQLWRRWGRHPGLQPECQCCRGR